jgi:imidazolonepropionase-like amidohydrolase
MVENGMSPMQAIQSATSVPSRLLGVDGWLGTLEPGKLADLVAVRGDPLGDIALLADPDRIRLVVRGGDIVSDRREAAVMAVR